ncbi:DUF4359 domain-containing protein [Bacillus sp. RAR_GA_16]|uniref:DUF4359 domain-containing protein n=1 Tax=Bacillus sp. RAR_GA_16 TaxID=2876774 RepID=UPI001CC9D27B|nr:DUF4359 domain-containing protein [Bacillus sp. RAR_GA_16]MCA0171977.1 DUF4359 domain-containing protein [Bacillus sp. RAR_GA_16]
MKKAILGVILSVAVIMFLTNPSEDDYSRWVGKQLKKDQNALIELGVDLAVVPYVRDQTSRTEAYVFSIYRTKLWDDKEIVAIGMFGSFYINQKNIEKLKKRE